MPGQPGPCGPGGGLLRLGAGRRRTRRRRYSSGGRRWSGPCAGGWPAWRRLPSLEPALPRFSDACRGPRQPDLRDQSEDLVVVDCRMDVVACYGAPRGVAPVLRDIGRAHLGHWGEGPDTGERGGLRYALEYQRDRGLGPTGRACRRPSWTIRRSPCSGTTRGTPASGSRSPWRASRPGRGCPRPPRTGGAGWSPAGPPSPGRGPVTAPSSPSPRDPGVLDALPRGVAARTVVSAAVRAVRP